jgi:hypothetical protein
MKFNFRVLVVVLALLFGVSNAFGATTIIETGDVGFYNDSIGRALDGTNGGDSGPFPAGVLSNDAVLQFYDAPDLSTAAPALGNWLTDPAHLNSNWYETPIPTSWPIFEEVAVIYQINTLGATDVLASFGVDNGIHVWLDGTYLFGARGPGVAQLGEYIVPLGDLSAGTHYLQILLSDHGVVDGYYVNVSAATFLSAVPEPETYAMLLVSLGLMGVIVRRRRMGCR